MRIGDLSLEQLANLAATSGLRYQTGPFTVCLHTQLPHLVRLIYKVYSALPVLDCSNLCQFHINLDRSKGLRYFIRPKSLFTIDSISPFEPYPLEQAFPLLEWGLNWCIGSTANQYLMLHSAVIEKNGRALIMPAMPGSGKSTLCAGLINRGWRLLSDEFGIVDPADGKMVPLPRVIPLKNESINIIKDFAPDAFIGPTYHKTRKGDVAHLAPPSDSLLRQQEKATPQWVVFPKFIEDAKTELQPSDNGAAFARLSNNSFNYRMTMETGFCALTKLARSVDCYSMTFGNLDDAITCLSEMTEGDSC